MLEEEEEENDEGGGGKRQRRRRIGLGKTGWKVEMVVVEK